MGNPLDVVDQASALVLERFRDRSRGRLRSASRDQARSRPRAAISAEWLDEEGRLDRLTTLTLSDLTDDELADLAVHHLGRPVRPEVLGAVTAASEGRPGRLVRLLSVPAVRKALTATDKSATLPADLDRYTKSQLLEQTFLALVEEDRDILCALSLFGPATLCRFLEGTLETHQVDRAVATGWVRRYADRVEFASRDLWRTAYHQDQLPPADEGGALNRLSAAIIKARSNNTWQAVDPALAESLLTALLDGQGATVVQAELLAELTRLRRVTGRFEANGHLIEQIKSRLNLIAAVAGVDVHEVTEMAADRTQGVACSPVVDDVLVGSGLLPLVWQQKPDVIDGGRRRDEDRNADRCHVLGDSEPTLDVLVSGDRRGAH